MSRVHRLRVADRIFFVTVNLRRSLTPFTAAEYALILASFQESRRRLGFLLSYPLVVATSMAGWRRAQVCDPRKPES